MECIVGLPLLQVEAGSEGGTAMSMSAQRSNITYCNAGPLPHYGLALLVFSSFVTLVI